MFPTQATRPCLALARRRRIGVDLERVCSGVNVLKLAERFFSPNEFKILRSLPPGIQREAFYCGWTRKEAYLKARGEGISSRLDSVEVSLIPGERAIIKKVSDDPNVSENWILEHLLPAPNYIGAVATEGHNLTFRFFDGNQLAAATASWWNSSAGPLARARHNLNSAAKASTCGGSNIEFMISGNLVKFNSVFG